MVDGCQHPPNGPLLALQNAQRLHGALELGEGSRRPLLVFRLRARGERKTNRLSRWRKCKLASGSRARSGGNGWSFYDHGKLPTIKLGSTDTHNSGCWESYKNHVYLTLEGDMSFIHSCVHSIDLLRLCTVLGSGETEMSEIQNLTLRTSQARSGKRHKNN